MVLMYLLEIQLILYGLYTIKKNVSKIPRYIQGHKGIIMLLNRDKSSNGSIKKHKFGTYT